MHFQKILKIFSALALCFALLLTIPVPASAYTAHTLEEAMNWVRSQVGNSIDMDGVYGAQCVDFIYAYYDYLGVPISSGDGADFAWNELPEGWVRIPDADPQPGDILVYTGDGGCGHVGIYQSDYITYHQNVGGHYVKEINFYYKNVDEGYWGIIRPDFRKDDSLPFQDVKDGAYYQEPVRWAVENEIADGLSDTVFAPDGSCSRGMVLTFLWKAAGSPEPEKTEHHFEDVAPGKYYEKPILWALEKGITDGTNSTRFSPDKPCTRAQMMTFLWRSKNMPSVSGDHSFDDVPSGSYYADAVRWAVNTEITDGLYPSRFAPEQVCTRGQAVTFLYRSR